MKTLRTGNTTARVKRHEHRKACPLFLPVGRLWWLAFLGMSYWVAALPSCSESGNSKGNLSDTDSPALNDDTASPAVDDTDSPTFEDDTDSTVPDVPIGTQGGNWSDLDGRAAPAHVSPPAENSGTVTLGGTITFANIGAPGYWGRRIEAAPGDDRCDVQAETLNYAWGGSEFCCRTTHNVTSNRLTPFNEQLAMVIEGPLKVKQFAVYQPLEDGGAWGLRSYWDRDGTAPFNILFVGPGDTTDFDGILGNNCAFHAMQEKPFPCGPGSDPYCPGSGLDYEGWAGSKLFVLLAAMPYTHDPELLPLSCIAEGEDEREQDAPWIGLGASELIRDGWAGYHPCHCFANTDGALGDGCGQINVFEVIAEASGAQWGNRDVISTGIRSYQVGSLGGSTCGIQGCSVDLFADDADLIDANHVTAMTEGAVIDADNRAMAEGPMWRRALDDRYYLILLDEATRTVQVAVIHPENVPDALVSLLPALPNELSRPFVDGLVQLRLPKGV